MRKVHLHRLQVQPAFQTDCRNNVSAEKKRHQTVVANAWTADALQDWDNALNRLNQRCSWMRRILRRGLLNGSRESRGGSSLFGCWNLVLRGQTEIGLRRD